MRIYKKNSTGLFELVQSKDYGQSTSYQNSAFSEDYDVMVFATSYVGYIVTGITQ